MKIIIPPLEKHKGRMVCPDKCPFSGSGDVCSWCSLGLAKKPNPDDPFFVRSFLKSPGENCPGPGEYQLVKVVRSHEDVHIFEKQL